MLLLLPCVLKSDLAEDNGRNSFSLDSRALLNKSLVLVKYFICGKVSKLFYHHDLYCYKTTDIASKFSATTKNVRSMNKYSKNIFECLDQCKH